MAGSIALAADHVVGAKESFVSVVANAELGGDVAEQGEEAGAVDELSGIVGIMGAHTYAEGGRQPDHEGRITDGSRPRTIARRPAAVLPDDLTRAHMSPVRLDLL
jgi:hypothetical protein